MGLRKNNPLDNSPHKLQKKVSPIKSSSGLLVTPKKTVIKSTAAANATIKKKKSWYKNGRRQQRSSSSSSSALHRSGQVIRSSRFQRQVILFLVVLFYHSENPDFSSLLSSSPFQVLSNNTTTATSQPRDGSGMTSRAVRTHAFYSWIPKGRNPTPLSAPLPPPKANHRTSPFWKETIQVAQDTSLAMVQQSQKVWNQFGAASMAVFSFRWAIPKRWKPQPLHPMSKQQKLQWLSSSPSPPPLSASSWPSSESSSMEAAPSYPQHYLRAASPATGSSPSWLSIALTPSKAPSHNTDDEDVDDEKWATATTTTTTTQNLHPSSPMVVTLARLWQQANRSPPQSWLPSSPAAATLSSFPSVGNDPNKFRRWVEKIYGASITTQHYDSHYRHGK